MNERIKQLAEQAGWGKGQSYDDCRQCSPFSTEGFAELIVKECVGLAKLAVLSNTSMDVIKEHFGVK